MLSHKIVGGKRGTSRKNPGVTRITVGVVKSQLGLLKRDITVNAHQYNIDQLEEFLTKIKTLRRLANVRE